MHINKILSNIFIFIGSFSFGWFDAISSFFENVSENYELIANFSGALCSTVVIGIFKVWNEQRIEIKKKKVLCPDCPKINKS